jgi:Zn/Cd-binding protein ZinT
MVQKPLYRILLAGLISSVLCQAIYMAIGSGYRSYNEQTTELILSKSEYDILFLGSSRILFHLNPYILDSICDVSSFNGGINGSRLTEINTVFNAYLSTHPNPKAIVLNIDLNSFGGRYFFNYNHYFPYLKNDVIKRSLKSTGHLKSRYQILPFLKLAEFDNVLKSNAFKGLTGKTLSESFDYYYKGYYSNGSKILSDADTIVESHYEKIEEKNTRSLDEIILTCRRRNISLVFMYSPEFNSGQKRYITNSDQILSLIDSVAHKNNIDFFRGDTLELCNKPFLFANVGHLNETGARLFSIIYGNHLRSLIQKGKIKIE